MHPWTLYALEVTRDRLSEARAERLLIEARAGETGTSYFRRPMAIALAALSRGSAAAARRLDECVADDLGVSLASSK
jgi:hypothetical protein